MKALSKRAKTPGTISLLVSQKNVALFVPDTDKQLVSFAYQNIGGWAFDKECKRLKFTAVSAHDVAAFDLQLDNEEDGKEIVRLMTDHAAGLGSSGNIASDLQNQQRGVLMVQRRAILDVLVGLLSDENMAIHMSAESAIVALSADDEACQAVAAEMKTLAVAAASQERFIQGAAAVALMKDRSGSPEIVAKLEEAMLAADGDWESWKRAAEIIIVLQPGFTPPSCVFC